MKLEYRIVATMTFENAADRDTWYTAVKTSMVNAKATKPVYKKAAMTKDEYYILEPETEVI